MLVPGSDNDVFNGRWWNAGDRSNRYRLGLAIEMRQRDVIAIAYSSFGGMRWDHAVARIVVQQARQEMVGFGVGVISVRPLIGELLLNCIKKLSFHNRWLLTRQDFTLVFDLADIESVAQQIEQRSAFEGNAATGRTGCAQSCLCSDVFLFEVPHQRIDSAEFEVSPVGQPDPLGFVFDDGNLAILHLIAEGQGTADPETLPL